MKRSIIQIVGDGAPGGGTTAVLGLCEDLQKIGNYEVILITDKDSYAHRTGAMLGLTVYGLNFFRSRIDFTLVENVSNIIQGSSSEIIHVHGGRAAATVLGPIGCRKNSMPVVYTVHGYHFPHKNRLIRPIFTASERIFNRSATHVAFVSRSDQEIADACGILDRRKNHSIIYNGINPEDIPLKSTSSEDGYLIYLARFHRQKNPLFPIEMMNYLSDLPLRLKMVGGGELEKQMREAVAKYGLGGQIDIVGPTPRHKALELLAGASMLIFPSLWEGLPIAPIEAMFCGVPVIATNISGTNEVVRNGVDGILLDSPTPKQFAESVRNMWLDKECWRKFSARARHSAVTRFNRIDNSRKYFAIYEALLSERSH